MPKILGITERILVMKNSQMAWIINTRETKPCRKNFTFCFHVSLMCKSLTMNLLKKKIMLTYLK
ncbi:hypothetical protein BG74_09135 [Sodalis-like endosymbiont of Proechinophthirus fluctus]|nr:hypothetical protein BG74_09135 [Sodalis-like endosymbiont of Proechinophthirus fluctus]